ncbi:MAG: iron-sulfur cluster insertion protein ErpA [Candidatus Omnitrophica bacterium]|nr:iron-sulfur cluster insertion protein ErpA [Candidatus Omnitrophota bacterium]MCA9417268.1 iron-sulfur cluster insertion protein ErpA [Candidatus Omnitrophota bacterium]MCA9425702.1 iron-sulfur cluster insertion protein ErpA [Candidatus Omnitrophota bacterium]MCA9440077.1 iron-sulfur cluster insertion protein ErpA [Candidatus Omnitrophota bacterium]MCB9768908.1 iron-sulfur cluster insertion protein ErpA [Candidatus Omnitrophota bacterium]
MIAITEGAASEAKRLMEQENLQEYVLRVGVQGGGCSGLSYTLGFDNTVNDTDHIMEDHGIRLVCDNKSMLYLNGAVLDYSSDLMGGGFKFNNPNAKTTCGCGSSFA